MKFKQALITLGIAAGLSMVTGNARSGVLVHLFQWKFNDIANECEKVLGPKGYEGVQITPPAEHLNRPDVWWSVYQPISLANFNSYGGSESELKSMITRCKAAGVKVYADAVFNNWASGSGTGTGGDAWIAGNYPRFSGNDFHSECSINSYGDRNQVQNCRLSGMPDLNTGSEYVQNEVATYMKTLLGWGVSGFRIDAAKHMAVSDLQGILAKAGNPNVYLEVIGADGEAVRPNEYIGLGRVTEFKYSYSVRDQFNGQIKNLKTIGESWGFLPSDKAQVFIVNHDNERGSAGGTGLNYKAGEKYNLANAFMLAWPYGWPQILSGYEFSTHDQGAPNTPGCGQGWNCEQRRPTISNMVMFRNFTEGQPVNYWWDNGNNQIAFGRGKKGFVVINNEAGSLNQSFQTALPAGKYCNILAGDHYCSGDYVTVDAAGKANFHVAGMQAAAIVADCSSGMICDLPVPDPVPVPIPPPMNLRGTFNGWISTPMTFDAENRVWSAIVDFDGKSDSWGGQRFRFDVFGNWLENYGDTEGDGKADRGSPKDIAFTSVGKYKVELKESDMSYTLTPVFANQAPKAVVSPATITVKVGEQVIFDASGSTDDVKVDSYSWSTGGAAKTEPVTFYNEGTEKVTLTVMDAEGLTSTATAVVTVNPEPQQGFISNFKQLNYRSSNNGWGAQAMTLVADNTWQTTIALDGRANQSMKLDASTNLSQVYGDKDGNGVLDSNSVALVPYKGTFVLTVNDETMAYTLVKQGDPYVTQLKSLYYAAPNSANTAWVATRMKMVADNLWYVRVKLNGVAKQRFRFDIGGKGVKGQVLGDSDKNGIVEVNGAPIYKSGKGYFIIKYSEKSKRYSIIAE